jgi:hypothetical protein
MLLDTNECTRTIHFSFSATPKNTRRTPFTSRLNARLSILFLLSSFTLQVPQSSIFRPANFVEYFTFLTSLVICLDSICKISEECVQSHMNVKGASVLWCYAEFVNRKGKCPVMTLCWSTWTNVVCDSEAKGWSTNKTLDGNVHYDISKRWW